MSNDYYLNDDDELVQRSDEELYQSHVIGEDYALHELNGMVASYFSTYQPV